MVVEGVWGFLFDVPYGMVCIGTVDCNTRVGELNHSMQSYHP